MSLYPALRNPLVRAPKWWLVDAHGHHVGRLASQLPKLLQGKYKPSWNPSVDCGDYVVIINAKHIKFTGKKMDQKYYKWHTGWVRGLKQRQAKVMLEKEPEEIMRKAVVRMMKRNALRTRYESRLLIYPEGEHPHVDQELTEFNPILSTPPTSIPRFSHKYNTDYSLQLTRDDQKGDWTLSARVFTPTQSKKVISAAKKAGWFGKGHTLAPAEPMYPDTVMLGPALTHTEWKMARELAAQETQPAMWPDHTTTAPNRLAATYLSEHTSGTLNRIKHVMANPKPKPTPTTPYLTSAEATEYMKKAPKTPPPKKK